MADAPKTHPDGSPIQEYPKMIYHEKGNIIVQNKAEEDELNGETKPETKSEEDKTKTKAPAWVKDK